MQSENSKFTSQINLLTEVQQRQLLLYCVSVIQALINDVLAAASPQPPLLYPEFKFFKPRFEYIVTYLESAAMDENDRTHIVEVKTMLEKVLSYFDDFFEKRICEETSYSYIFMMVHKDNIDILLSGKETVKSLTEKLKNEQKN